MKSLALGAGLLAMAIVPAACTTGAAGSSATGGSQMVSVTPAIKAEIRRQGHDTGIAKHQECLSPTLRFYQGGRGTDCGGVEFVQLAAMQHTKLLSVQEIAVFIEAIAF